MSYAERKKQESKERDAFRDAIKPLASYRQRRAWDYVQRLEGELGRARVILATVTEADTALTGIQLAREYMK